MTFATTLILLVALPSNPQRAGATCIAALDDTIALGGHGGVDLFVAGKRSFLGDRRNVFALTFAGDLLVEAGGQAGETGLVQCWQWKTGKLLWSRRAHDDAAVAVAATEKLVFSGGADKRIVVLEASSGEQKKHLEGHSQAVLALAVDRGGSLLASGGADGVLRLWSIDRLELTRSIHNHAAAINALAWSPDGKHLASGSSDRTVRIWQPGIGRLVRILRGHEDRVLSLAFGEKHLFSGCADGKVRQFDATSDTLVATLAGHRDWVVGVALANQEVVSVDWSGRALLWEAGRARDLGE